MVLHIQEDGTAKYAQQYIWILGLAIFVTWLVECVDTLAVVNGLLMLKN